MKRSSEAGACTGSRVAPGHKGHTPAHPARATRVRPGKLVRTPAWLEALWSHRPEPDGGLRVREWLLPRTPCLIIHPDPTSGLALVLASRGLGWVWLSALRPAGEGDP